MSKSLLEKTVSLHRLLVCDVVICSASRKKKRMCIPRLKVWKPKEPIVKQEFAWLVTDRKDEVFEADNVESKWNAMKAVWQKATEQVCGWTKGPPRHGETWWWNDEVAKAIEEKRRCYMIWYKTKTASDKNKYKEARRNARRNVALAQEKTRQELVNEVESTAGKKNVYRVAKQMANFFLKICSYYILSGLDALGINCVKDANGKVLVENDQVKEEWRKYMEKTAE